MRDSRLSGTGNAGNALRRFFKRCRWLACLAGMTQQYSCIDIDKEHVVILGKDWECAWCHTLGLFEVGEMGEVAGSLNSISYYEMTKRYVAAALVRFILSVCC